MRVTVSAVLFLTAMPALSAQQATVSYFGKSCCASTTSVTGFPRIGQIITLRYTGPNYALHYQSGIMIAQPHLVLGLSDRSWSGVTLPWTLPIGIGSGAGCQLLISREVSLAAPSQGNAFRDSFSFRIPNDKNLLGVAVFAQWTTHMIFQWNNGPTSSVWCTANAAKLTIGN